QRHGKIRKFLFQNLPDPPFMLSIDERMQEPDGDAGDLQSLQFRYDGMDTSLIEFRQNLTRVVQSLDDGEAKIARNQRFREDDIDIILIISTFVPHFENVTKPLGRQQRGTSALSFDDRVGRQGRSMDNKVDIARRDRRGIEDRLNSAHDTDLRSGGR